MTTTLTDAPRSRDLRRWIALVVLCIGQLVIVVDATVVNVALPVIERNLGFSQASLAWVVNAYLVTFGGLLLLAGRLGDLLGRRRVFLAGLGLFTVASACCGFAGSSSMLIAARFVQGIGAALSSSMVLWILVNLFPRGPDRGRAMTTYALVGNVGGSIGLLVGGTLVQLLSWHWIFFINIPIGCTGFVGALALIDNDEGIGLGGGVDWAGGLLVVGAPTAAVWAIVRASDYGWLSIRTIGLLLVALGLGAAFFLTESRVRNPLVPLRIFASRSLAAANLIRFCHGLGMSTISFCGALYLQHVHGFTPFGTGLAFMPLNLTIGFCSVVVVARLIRHVRVARPIVPGFAMFIVAFLLLARSPLNGSYTLTVLPSLVLLGVGASLVFLPTVTLAMTGVAPEESGLASGLTNVTLQIGFALGTALAASVSSTVTNHDLAHHEALRGALSAGYHVSFLVGIVGPLIGATLAIVLLGKGRTAQRSDVAPELEALLIAE